MKEPPMGGGGEETLMRHLLGNTVSVASRGSDWALAETPGRRARSAWASHERDEKAVRVLPEAIQIIEAELEAHMDRGRTAEAAAASLRLHNARTAKAEAEARLRVYEGRA